MHVPSRILYGGRAGTPVALIASTAAVTLLFASTAFLLAPISERYGVSEGIAGFISVVQVGAFALANFILPRLFRPSGRILRIGALALVAFNALSMLPDHYAVLLVLRFGAGAAAGTMTWLAWSNAMKRHDSMASIAATGPVTALVASPILSVLADSGDRVVYGVLAIAAIPAAVFLAPLTGRRRTRGAISASRSNRVLLFVLFAFLVFGSALYINQAIVARDIHHLTGVAASIAFSLNALGGLVGARLSARHNYPGWFMASVGLGLLVSVFGGVPGFYLGMFWWGFAFWMSIPGVLQMLVDRSLEPGERAGDGQGVMALGRSAGPVLGGVFVNAGSLEGLAIVTATGIGVCGLGVAGVRTARDRLPPTDPETLDQQH